jgi:hypothetical protein
MSAHDGTSWRPAIPTQFFNKAPSRSQHLGQNKAAATLKTNKK